MIRLIVFSDTHGTLAYMRAALVSEEYDAIIHLGDCAEDAAAVKKEHPAVRFISVAGNCDYAAKTGLPDMLVEVFEDVRVFVTHGHIHNVKSTLKTLSDATATRDCALALFGHTHRPMCHTSKGVTLFNPGACRPQYSGPSYGLVVIDGGCINAEIIQIK